MNKAQRAEAARAFACPRCRAQPFFSCRTAQVRWRSLKVPHAERLALVVEQP